MRLVFIILLSLYPLTISFDEPYFNFVLWNVGQGSWQTFIDKERCIHIDMGGEVAPLKKVFSHCKWRKNIIFLSHTDWDHINKIKIFKRSVKSLCLIHHPLQKIKNSMSSWLAPIPLCQKLNIKSLKKIYSPSTHALNRNEASHIYTINNKILLTGDSTKKMEKKWIAHIPFSIQWIVLGHHGSNTSTSRILLNQRKFKMAFVSARKDKYGHPHKKVVERLKKAKVPLISTEIWGNIYLEI